MSHLPFPSLHLRLRRPALWVGLVLLLASCGSLEPPTPTEFAFVGSVSVSAEQTRHEIEAAYDGEIISWHPEAGFAVLGFYQENGGLTTLSANADSFTSPEVGAAGYTAWAGGYTAWAGGYTAWAGGWTAWAGGWTAWAGGNSVPAPTSENQASWEQIGLLDAHRLSRNFGEGVTVAVIDSGVDLDHPGLAGRLTPSSTWRDYVDDDNTPDEVAGGSSYGHGTGVAGVILQVAPKATILPLRVLDEDGTGNLDDVIVAIDHAIAVGADIINLSLGTDGLYQPFVDIVNYAASQKVYLVASAGNGGDLGGLTYPARMTWWEGVEGYLFGIGSVDSDDFLSPFSDYGTDLFGLAPGENVFSLHPDGQSAFYNGTSFAAPMVAGALALGLSELPSGADRHAFSSYLSHSLYQGDLYTKNQPLIGSSAIGQGRLDVAGLLRALPTWSEPATLNALARTALFVANSTNLGSADQALVDRLTAMDFTVSVVADENASLADASGRNLVLVSKTISSGSHPPPYRDLPVPLVTWEDGIYDDLGMASVRGDTSGHTGIAIVDGAHPLAAGLTGTPTIYTDEDRLAYAVPGVAAATVATVPGNPTRAVVFSYEPGDAMVGHQAPARRIGLPYQNSSSSRFSADAYTIFDAAVRWAVGEP